MKFSLLAFVSVGIPLALSGDIQYPTDATICSPQVTSWGTWGDWAMCPERYRAVGCRTKVEGSQTMFSDDTAMNGMELLCANTGTWGPPYVRIKSLEGPWGEWSQDFICPDNKGIIGFRLRSEKLQNGLDDTAANNIIMYCDGDNTLNPPGMSWGEWTEPKYCPADMSVCGIQTQVEEPFDGDDTAMNNANFACCAKN